MTYDEAREISENLISARDWINQMIVSGVYAKYGADSPKFVDEIGTWVDKRAEIGSGTIVFPGCSIKGKTKIGKRCIIDDNTVLLNFTCGDDCHIGLTAKKNSTVGNGCKIGEMAEMNRCVFGDKVNFVHHGYMGDSTAGDESNVGAGFITANYDGRKKHKTIFGPRCFLGVNSSSIAPNEYPEGTIIAAGSIVLANIKNILKNLSPYSIIKTMVLNMKAELRKDLKK